MAEPEPGRVAAQILEPEAHPVTIEPAAEGVGDRQVALLAEGQQGILLVGFEGHEGAVLGRACRGVEGAQGGAVGLRVGRQGREAPAVAASRGEAAVDPGCGVKAGHRQDPGQGGSEDREFHRIEGFRAVGGIVRLGALTEGLTQAAVDPLGLDERRIGGRHRGRAVDGWLRAAGEVLAQEFGQQVGALQRQEMADAVDGHAAMPGEMGGHQRLLGVGAEIGILRTRQDQGRRVQDSDAAAPILTGAGLEPSLPGRGGGPEHVGHRTGLHFGIEIGTDIGADEVTGFPFARLRIRVDPGAHLGPALLRDRLGARRRTGDQDEIRQPREVRVAILGAARQGERHLGAHAVAGDREGGGRAGTDRLRDVIGHRVDREPGLARRFTKARQVYGHARQNAVERRREGRPAAGTSAEEMQAEQEFRFGHRGDIARTWIASSVRDAARAKSCLGLVGAITRPCDHPLRRMP